jgi:hypothetical protein
MNPDTIITFNIGVGTLIIGIILFFLGLLAIIWKGKSEIASTINEQIKPFNSMAHAITEIQSILKSKFNELIINHSMVERGSSPLKPTSYGVKLIKDSGLEKILDEQKDFLCTRLKAKLDKDYTEYDIQENARNLLVELKNDPMMNPVKDYVYNNPIDIKIILQTGGLWLRDDFLKKHRGISNNETK